RVAAGRAGPRGDRADLVYLDPERVRDRERDPRNPAEVHVARRPLAVHRPEVLGALGAVRRGRADRGHPGCAPLRVPPALHRGRADPGRGQGMSATELDLSASLLDRPHHDGSELYVVERPEELGGEAVVRIRVPQEVESVVLRWVEDGEARGVKASEEEGGWWRARFPVPNPNVRYRWLLSGGGVEAHLDHIESLGANVIYLTPVFPAGSTHRYDSTTFERVDPLLGGDEALASLTRAAHARGIRVISDLTTNHTGDKHEWFVGG